MQVVPIAPTATSVFSGERRAAAGGVSHHRNGASSAPTIRQPTPSSIHLLEG
jgi:hypothetical protein